MPLIHGYSDKSRQKNIKTEIDAGKPIKQAVAIGYSEQREAEKHKMSKGGMCEACGGPCKYGEGGKVYDVGATDTIPAKERGIMNEGYAEGGEVDEEGSDNDLMDMACEELLSAIESKNKKEILESLKAIILSCK